jgi:small subunit ribosomal protein S16
LHYRASFLSRQISVLSAKIFSTVLFKDDFMVVIRMACGGMKKAPFYRVVAADKRSPRDGRFIERLGFFNPVASGKAERLKLDLARIDYWVSQGAQMSDRVRSLVNEARRSLAA